MPRSIHIHRLVRRNDPGGTTYINIISDFLQYINAFLYQNKKWNADVMNEEVWEKDNHNLKYIIPAEEILVDV